jgi:acyl carrier protein
MLRAVSGRAPWSELNVGDADSDSRVVGESSDRRAPDDADAVALRLVGFVNTHVMARSRPIQPDDELEAAGVDSMGLLKILLFVEAEFGFWMPDADLRTENVSSLRRLAGYVSRRMTLA